MWHGWNFSIAQNLVFSSPWLVQKSHIDHIDHMVATNMQLPPAFEGPRFITKSKPPAADSSSLWAPRVSSEPLRSQPGPGVPPMDGTSSSCWMTDDGWVNWAQLGSIFRNRSWSQSIFRFFHGNPWNGENPGSAGYRCARCAPCSAQKRNQGKPGAKLRNSVWLSHDADAKMSRNCATSTCTSRCNDSADNNTWVNSSAMDFTTEPLLIKYEGCFPIFPCSKSGTQFSTSLFFHEMSISNGYGSKLGTPIIGWLILN